MRLGPVPGLGMAGAGGLRLRFRLGFRVCGVQAGLDEVGSQRLTHLERVQELLRSEGMQSERCHQAVEQLAPA